MSPDIPNADWTGTRLRIPIAPMQILPRTKTPGLTVETVAHGTWDLAQQAPKNFTLAVFYRGNH